MLIEIYKRIKFWNSADRIGPDIPTTYWMLFFKSTMYSLCKRKFKNFDRSSEFRPGAYAVGCSHISIGKRVTIRPGSMLIASPDGQGEIVIEDGALLGVGVHIYVTTHQFKDVSTPIIDQGFREARPVILKKGCWIGAGVIILPGVSVGENAVVGAGSIVTKSIPDKVLAVGNPARVLRRVDGTEQ